jgi:hypothetical protein
VEELLRGFGAPPRGGADPAEWLPRALAAAGVRRLRHPGNHRYLFRLGDRAARRSVFVALPSLPYPKGTDRPAELAAERTPHETGATTPTTRDAESQRCEQEYHAIDC